MDKDPVWFSIVDISLRPRKGTHKSKHSVCACSKLLPIDCLAASYPKACGEILVVKKTSDRFNPAARTALTHSFSFAYTAAESICDIVILVSKDSLKTKALLTWRYPAFKACPVRAPASAPGLKPLDHL